MTAKLSLIIFVIGFFVSSASAMDDMSKWLRPAEVPQPKNI